MFLTTETEYEEKAKDLANAITNSETFQTHRKRKKQVEEDEDLHDMRKDLFHHRKKAVNTKSSEAVQKYKELLQTYRKNEKVKNYLEAKQDMQEMVNEINEYIQDEIDMPFLYKKGGGTCSGI